MEPRARSSIEQYSTIVEFMETYGDISRPQPGPQGRIRADQLWDELSNMLNAIGGGVQRRPNKWKKVWVDWKSKTKKKAITIRRHASGTGGGPRLTAPLSSLEERVLAILGPLAVAGQENIQEIGLLNTNNNIEQQIEVHHQDEPLSHSSPVQSTVELLVVGSSDTQEYTPASPRESLGCPPAPNALPPTPLEAILPPIDSLPVPPASRSISLESSRLTGRGRLGSPRGRTRSRRNLTPFEKASESFVRVEEQRLAFEERREENLHVRETQRLQLESERLQIQRQSNVILERMTEVVGELITFLRDRNL
ncbi:hypothetical protein ACJJTC_018898 [Scirpophaga incertulas]